jgi:hypothetical protein
MMKQPPALLAVALLSIGTAACGDAGRRAHPVSQASSRVVTGAAASIPSGGAVTQRYLNDGDNDPSSDNDEDDLNGKTIDEDHDGPEDHVNPENDRYHDGDDGSVVAYGRSASAVEERVIAALVERYHAVAVAGAGAVACSLIAPSVAGAIPEDYGRAPGPTYLRGGKTCSAVMSLLFKHAHGQLAGAVEVTGVRVEGDRAIALLGSGTMPAGDIIVRREHGAWKIDGLIEGPLP